MSRVVQLNQRLYQLITHVDSWARWYRLLFRYFISFHYGHFSAQVNKIPQMRKSNGHLSNKNVLSNFLKEFLLREESFNLAGRSFQTVGPETLNDLGPIVIVLVLGMYSCPDVATVFGRASTRLRCSRSPGREVPNRSSTGASKWGS